MEFSEACQALAEDIQSGSHYPETCALMLQVFYDAKQDGETNRMALALARDAVRPVGDLATI